jgi:hypothetical protein
MFGLAAVNLTLVGIHVRRGDYAQLLSQLYKMQLVGKEYYVRAMDVMRKSYQVRTQFT